MATQIDGAAAASPGGVSIDNFLQFFLHLFGRVSFFIFSIVDTFRLLEHNFCVVSTRWRRIWSKKKVENAAG